MSATTHDFVKLCQKWHGGQWSAFYKYQCNGGFVDYEHASDCMDEAVYCMGDDSDNRDYDILMAFYNYASEYWDRHAPPDID
jgi:hypothetical protein